MNEKPKNLRSPRKVSDDQMNPYQSVKVYMYDGEIPLENAGKETLQALTDIVGQLRRENHEINLHWQVTRQLLEWHCRPWWKKLFGMPQKIVVQTVTKRVI